MTDSVLRHSNNPCMNNLFTGLQSGKVAKWQSGNRQIEVRNSQFVAILLVLSLLLAGCGSRNAPTISANVVEAMSGTANAGFARAFEPIEFKFPRDHGAHPDYRTEWWYYTGNLSGENGEQFGYQLTFFRSALVPIIEARASDWATNQIYMAHFAVTDGVGGKHHSFERFSRGGGELAGAISEPHYEVWLDDWVVSTVSPGVTHLMAHNDSIDGPIALDLELRQTRQPVLHGNRGLSQKGVEAGNASYYYSLVGLESTGTVTIGEKATTVTGLSWKDHEFGTSALSKDAVGWDWFSVQLNSGVVMMFAQIRNKDGSNVGVFTGTLAWPDGRQQTLTSDDFKVQVIEQWTSPRSQVIYPSGWQVTFPDLGIDLAITPLIQDQEMQVSFRYWEGAVDVSGTFEGAVVVGRGYVELTGYGGSSGEYQR